MLRATGISDHSKQEIEKRKLLTIWHSELLLDADTKSADTSLDHILEISFNNKLPSKLLRLIFHNLQDNETLLNCRLVCKSWKKAIDKPSRANLMKRLAFNIYDWHSFYESKLIDVVKSIRIILPWKNINSSSNSNYYWSEFTNRIGKTIQKIVFDFQQPNYISNEEFISRAIKIIRSLLAAADGRQLEELHILNENVLNSLCDKSNAIMPSCKNIKTLVLVKAAKLLKILEFFPNLVKLQLKDTEEVKGHVNWTLEKIEATRDINNMLFEYVILKHGSLQEVMLDKGTCYQYCKEWYNLMFACYNYAIKLKLNSTDQNNSLRLFPILDTQYLFSHIETIETPINDKTCQYFQTCDFSFGSFTTGNGTQIPENIHRLEYCTNLTYLGIVFWRPVATMEELKFLTKLQKLRCVSLSGISGDIPGYSYELARSPLEILNLLCTESLLHLEIKWNLFGSNATEKLASYFIQFKNLKTIVLKFMPFTPNDIFIQLSKILSLQNIEFHIYTTITSEIKAKCLTDDMFTQFCESQREDLKGFMVPAITAFNKLRWLRINIGIGGCKDLTDEFIVNGIALSETLTDILLWNLHDQLTEASFLAVRKAGFEDMNIESYPGLIRLKRSVQEEEGIAYSK